MSRANGNGQGARRGSTERTPSRALLLAATGNSSAAPPRPSVVESLVMEQARRATSRPDARVCGNVA